MSAKKTKRKKISSKSQIRRSTDETAVLSMSPKIPRLINSSHEDEIATFVFMGLTGTSVLPIPPRLLEISMFALRRDDVLLMPGQGLPRVGNRLTLSFHPQRSIPIWTMQHTGMLNSTVKDESTFSHNDFDLMNGFLARLPKPVCLVSYQAELYDFFVLRRELHKIRKTFDDDLLCVSLRKAVCALCKDMSTFDLVHVHEKLCGGLSSGEDTAENTVEMAMDVYSKLQGVLGWIDTNFSFFHKKE